MMRPDRLVWILAGASLGLLLVVTLAGAALFSTSVALSALAGGTLAIINLLWQRRTLGILLSDIPVNRPVASALVRFLLRISFSAVILYLIITSRWFSLWGLLAGLSVTVLCLFGLTLYLAIQTKENES